MNTRFAPLLLVIFLSSAHADTRVGFSEIDLALPDGVPLAGFGGGKRRQTIPDIFNLQPYTFWLKPSRGVLDPVRSKAMAIEVDGKRVVIVSTDLVGVSLALRETVLGLVAGTGLGDADLIVTATHTHSGPGALAKNLLWETIAVDRFSKKLYRHVTQKVANGIEQALANLAPARLEHTVFDLEGLQQNRSGREGHFDRATHLLAAKSPSGEVLGAMVNYGVHATHYGAGNLMISADIAGAVEHGLAQGLKDQFGAKQPVVLFVNSAEGDVSPKRPASGGELTDYGAAFTEQALTSWPRLLPVSGPLRSQTLRVEVGAPSFNAKACIKQSFLRKMLGFLRPSLAGIMPRYSKISAISIGDLVMATWPGEPTTTVGLEAKRLATQVGFSDVMLLGLGQDHLGYFTTADEYKRQAYESCSSMYGPNGASRLLTQFEAVVGAVAR